MQRPFHAFSWVCKVVVSVYYGKTPSISGTLVASYHSHTLPGSIFIVLYSIPLLHSKVYNKPRQEFHNVMFHLQSMKQLCFFNVHSVNPQVMLLMWAGHFLEVLWNQQNSVWCLALSAFAEMVPCIPSSRYVTQSPSTAEISKLTL